MIQRKRISKDGKRVLRRGLRLPRIKRFDPNLPTSSDIKVRSKYEQICVDYFMSHNISFQYEPLMLLDGRQYRPDFFLPRYNLFIEICGFDHMPHYRDRVARKKELYDKHSLKAVFIHYRGKGSLTKMLAEALSIKA